MHAGIFRIALAIGMATLTDTVALAQTGREQRLTQAIAEAALLLRRQVRPGQQIAEIRQRMLAGFEAADLDAGGIGPSDAELGEAKAAAEQRARRVSELLRHDLDGDGAVTVAEARRSLLPEARRPLRSAAGTVMPTPAQVEATLDELVRKLNLPDADGDGRASFAEILESTTAERAGRAPRPRPPGPQALDLADVFDLDGDGDGTIARDEFEEALDPLLARIDADGDGTVSPEEAQAFQDYADAAHRRVARRIQAEKQAAALRARVAACPIPEVPANAELIYLGIFKGEVISPILIGDANRVTYLGDIRIEEGDRPIYLMLGASSRIVLRFGGDVDRLAHVVSLGTDLVGFAGLERRQAFWLTGPDCALEGWNPGATRGHSVFERAYVEALAGRRLDKVGGPGNVGLLELPSGDIIERLREPGQTLRREGPSGPSFKSLPSAGPQDLPSMTPDAVLVPPGVTKMVMLK